MEIWIGWYCSGCEGKVFTIYETSEPDREVDAACQHEPPIPVQLTLLILRDPDP